jgi:hypothetical protein
VEKSLSQHDSLRFAAPMHLPLEKSRLESATLLAAARIAWSGIPCSHKIRAR